MTATREPGWYWVRYEGDRSWLPKGWQIARWDIETNPNLPNSAPSWIFAYCDSLYSDDELAEIDERRIERQP